MQSSIYAAVMALAGMTAVSQYNDPIDASYFEETSELCVIQSSESDGMLHLVAYAAEGVEGEYVFSMRQSGPNGSGQTMQSGEIDGYGNGPTLLSEVSINSDTSFSASLQIYSYGDEMMCHKISG